MAARLFRLSFLTLSFLMMMTMIPAAGFAATPTTITLSSSPNSSILGQPVTLTAILTPSYNTDNETVTFYDGATVLGTGILSGGQATLTTILLPFGTRSLFVRYGGDNLYDPSTSPNVPHVVNAFPGAGFKTALHNSAGSNLWGASDIAVGDFNADYRADFAVVNIVDDSISVFIGTGDGTFQAAVHYVVGNGPSGIDIADFNRDGKSDLVVSGPSNVTILTGNGDGTFQRLPILSQSGDGDDVRAGDFNRDGKADIAFARGSVGGVGVRLGNGDGTFQTTQTFGAGVATQDVQTADLNGDGVSDLLAVAGGNQFERGGAFVLFGVGDGTFATAVKYTIGTWVYNSPEAGVIADFNGDRSLDFAVAGNDYGATWIRVYTNNGSGGFTSAPVGSSAYDLHSITAGDVNGDGVADLIYTSGVDSFLVRRGNGDGSFQNENSYNAGSSGDVDNLAAADFDGDGITDVAAVHTALSVTDVSVSLGRRPTTTITTSPTGRSFIVDGVTYTSTKTFSWAPGSLHTIEAATPQSIGAGSQYAFNTWSDGGAASHVISAPTANTTFTANFKTQYQLTINVSPLGYGAVTPESGMFFDAGSTVTVNATANSGYGLVNWTGPVAASSSASTTVNMTGPLSVTANFARAFQFTVATSPAGRNITVDATTYTGEQTFTWAEGSSHTISVASPQSGGSGKQYVFSNWSDGGARTHTVTAGSAPATYTANFTTQYQLTTAVSPAGSGTVSPASGTFYNEGAVVNLTATANAGNAFVNWAGPVAIATNAATTVTMSAAQSVTANFQPAFTVTTSPAGLTISVDGNLYTAPRTFVWADGSNHTIGVATSQSGGTGKQYVFSNWSDNGEQEHTVTAGANGGTYTATFTTQYQLTTTTAPAAGGTVLPASGTFYDQGTVVNLTATPNPGYTFANWTGSVANVNNAATTVTMSAARSVTANFHARFTVTTIPEGRSITVDGNVYTSPQSFSWASGSSHSISTSTPQSGGSGKQYAFSNWSDGGARTHTITAGSVPRTYTANFTTQYQLTTAVSPAGSGTVSPASGTFYNEGTVVNLTATANAGNVFVNWTGSVANANNASTTVTMSDAQSVTANFVPAFTVTTSPAGLSISVDGNVYTAPRTFGWAAGSIHTIGVASPQSGGTGKQYVFSNWSDNGEQEHTVTAGAAASTYTANFTTQYQLTAAASPAAGGTVLPPSGTFYDQGTIVNVTATPNPGYTFANWTGSVSNVNTAATTVTMSAARSVTANFNATFKVTTFPEGLSITVDGNVYTSPQSFSWASGSSHSISTTTPQSGGTGKQYVFSNWSDGGARTHTVTAGSAPATYTANFTTQYQLTTAVAPAGRGTVSPASGTFYNEGTVVNLTATANTGYGFVNWTGSVANANNAATTVTMSEAQSVTANFAAAFTVTTSPAGRSITVDGNLYTAPRTFLWAEGSNHTIGVASPQSGGAGSQYVFSNWSDAGEQTHTVTAGATPATYTAAFTTQYQLTTAIAYPGSGTVTPASGNYYNSGDVVNVQAASSPGYKFMTWEGPVADRNQASTTVTMTGPLSVTAYFSVTVTISTVPAGMPFWFGDQANGMSYEPVTLEFMAGSTIDIGTESVFSAGSGVQYVFNRWSDGGAIVHSAIATPGATFVATFNKQYELVANVSPAFSGSIYPPGGYFDAGSVVGIAATPDTGYLFTSWTGPVSNPANPSTTVIMNGPVAVTANLQPGREVTITTSPAGRTFSVDGVTYNSLQRFSWLDGSVHTIGAASPQAGAAGTRYVFSNWSDGGDAVHTLASSATRTSYIATFSTQYQLTTTTSPAGGGSIAPSPASSDGYYAAGTPVQMLASASPGFTFGQWTGDLTGTTNPQTVTMSAPRSVNAQFNSVPSSQTLGINLAGVPGASLSFAGNSTFTFLKSQKTLPGVQDFDFMITGQNGFAGAAALQGLSGTISGNFAIGEVTTSGGIAQAPVTGAGTLSIFDGSKMFTASVQWATILQYGTLGALNSQATINLSSFSYNGTNANLMELAARPNGSFAVSFPLLNGVTLSSLKTTARKVSYSGSIASLPPQ